MTWPAILALAGGVYAMKALGPLAMRGRELPERWRSLTALVAVPMLAALVVIQTATDGSRFVADARLPAVAVAAIAVWRRAPFALTIVLAGATSAVLHIVFTR
jgi:branched-subunit amino acid transport protein